MKRPQSCNLGDVRVKLKPLYDRVVIARKIFEHVSAGGIVMMLEHVRRSGPDTLGSLDFSGYHSCLYKQGFTG